ncbi:MAG: DUF5687 family protein [Paludibacteraceae bacterium]
MLITDLIKLDFRKNFRSQTFYRGLAVKLLMGFMAIYFAVIFLILGLALGDILGELHDELTPLEVLNGASLYIVIGALLIRFFMQSLNTVNLNTYQTLPVKRNTLVQYILLKPLFSVVNYLTLLIIIPFAVKSVFAYYPGWVAVRFVINCLLIIWMNIWLASYLKRRFGTDMRALLVILVLFVAIVALEYFKIFSLFDTSVRVFNFLTIQPFGWLITPVATGMAYGLNRIFFAKNYYPEKFNEKLTRGENKVVGGLTFLEKYGTIGELIQLQIRLIFRHKRTKSLMYMSAFFILYGLLFYTSDIYSESMAWMAFCGLIITGMASMMYGQYIMGWESSYFDTILTKNIPTDTYVKANFYLLIGFNVLSFIISIAYAFLGIKYLYLHIAMFLFNTGINVFLLMFFATFNTKRIDLMAKSSFNYQGTTYKSFLIILPIMMLPIILAGVLNIFLTFNLTLIVIGLLGFIGILTIPFQIKICSRQFNSRKYIMAQGFREKL